MPNKPAQTDTEAARALVRQEMAESAELQWWQTKDGLEHAVRIWKAPAESAIVFYFHGIQGHSRWFEDTALELNKKGVTVFAPDRRGAGSSKALRGHCQSWQQLADDADEILSRIRTTNPDRPIFLVANCWGARVALILASRPHNAFLKGLAMTSPAVSMLVDVKLVTKFLIGLSLLTGGKHYFEVPLAPEQFTDVPVYVDYIQRDVTRLTRATASFFFASIKLTKASKAVAEHLQLPILILQAGRDQIVNVQDIKTWFNGLKSKDKTLRVFENAAHSLDFDPYAAEYQDALADWILARVK